MNNFDVQTISINSNFEKVFEYLVDPKNLPSWTSAFKVADKHSAILVTPSGEVQIKLNVVSDKTSGIIDWHMIFPDNSVGITYSRVVSINKHEVLYSFIMLTPPVPPEQIEKVLEAQIETLKKELRNLKKIMEKIE